MTLIQLLFDSLKHLPQLVKIIVFFRLTIDNFKATSLQSAYKAFMKIVLLIKGHLNLILRIILKLLVAL